MNSAGLPHSQAAGPFGYAFSYQPEQQQPVTETVEIPTAGPTLLNHHEDDYISSFFTNQLQHDMSAGSYDMQIQEAQNQLHGTPMADYGWLLHDHAPTFVGASATPKPSPGPYQNMPQQANFDFGALPDNSHLLSANFHHNNMMPQPMMTNVPIHHQAPQQQLHTPSLVSAPSTEASDMLHTSETLQTMPVSSTPLMIVPPPSVTTHDHHELMTAHPMTSLEPLDTAQGIHLDGPHTAPARMDEVTDTRLYRFGSDSHFSTDGFQPHSQSEHHEIIAQRLTEELRMLKPINRSNNPTRASSPTFRAAQLAHAQQGHSKKRSSTHLEPTEQQSIEDDEDHENRPRKRRKDSDDDVTPTSAKRKFSVPNSRLRRVSTTEPASASKRRRSSLTGSAKAGASSRENLTEEQKRSNHIQSEQKRRNLIKMGFDELRRIVPELRGGGLSKSMELTEVSNYLDLVVKANEEMRRRLGIPLAGGKPG